MDDEKLKLTILNKILIFITTCLFVGFIVSLVFLILTLNKKQEEIPDLYVIKGKTSTLSATTKKTETTTTISTTTIKNIKSPYYDVDVDKVLSDPLFQKSKNITKDEATQILESFYKILNSIYDVNDNSFLNIKAVTYYAKPNEIDKIKEDEDEYGIIYNGDELLNKIFISDTKVNALKQTYKGKKVFIKTKDNNYYRIKSLGDDNKLELISLKLNDYNMQSISGTITYYETNYKEQGYTAPQYKSKNIRLTYLYGRWKVSDYYYPLYER